MTPRPRLERPHHSRRRDPTADGIDWAADARQRAVNYMLKRAAINAGINPKLSAHWHRHAHASHAIDRGAALPLVQSTLGHGNIAVTSGYLHARPGDSSGLSLDPGVFLQRG